jgi:hypothetical protein
MEKLDRLGWAAGIALSAYGVKIGIRCNRTDVLDQLIQLRPPNSAVSSSPVVEQMFSIVAADSSTHKGVKRFNLAYLNDSRLVRDFEIENVLRQVESEMQRVVAEEALTYHFVHAGVVEWAGKAVLIPGRTLSGKSSLVVEFLRAGACYYSDEYAVLDSTGRVHPFPRRLVTRDSAGRATTEIEPEKLGITIGKTPLPVGVVLLTQYRPQANWDPRRLSSAKSILALLSNSLSARRDPARAMRILGKIAASSYAFKSNRGEAGQVVKWAETALK